MQARYYDPVVGRFLSNDPVGWTGETDSFSRYAYAGNNPYKYVDPDGRLKKNIFGQIDFDKVGSSQMANHPSGVFSKFQPGHVTADDGTKIVAFKNVGKDERMDTDCHGQTFTDGKFWINNDQVNGILQGDGYKQVDTPKSGDVVVYKEGGDVVHSVTVSDVNSESGAVTVTGLGGIETEPSSSSVVPGEGGGWSNPDATYEYYRKED